MVYNIWILLDRFHLITTQKPKPNTALSTKHFWLFTSPSAYKIKFWQIKQFDNTPSHNSPTSTANSLELNPTRNSSLI